MEAESESILLLNWIDNSGVLTSTDYAFLTNLYLEVIHLAEQLPPTSYGEELKRELVRKGSQISNRIDGLEYSIDTYMGEYFEATADEIYDETEDPNSTDKDYRKTVTKRRVFEINYVWEVTNIEGPLGKISREFTYDFTEYEKTYINDAVESWVDNMDWISDLDLDGDDEMGSETYHEEIEVEVDDSKASITLTVSVELTINWTGDDNYDTDGWEEY